MKKKHASLAGIMAREVIRFVVGRTKSSGMLAAGAKHSKSVSKWKAPRGYTLQKLNMDGLPMEMLTAQNGHKDKVILLLHGGAYVIGLENHYRRQAVQYSKLGGGVSVLTVDYRIAPQYQYPAALEDALTAWGWLMDNGYKPENIIFAGDSAGGNLALALALKLRDGGGALPCALVLMSPWANLAGAGESHSFNYNHDPMFGRSAGGSHGTASPYAGQTALTDPYLSPVYAEYSRFPPMLIQAGTWEMLLSDSRTVAQKAKSVGVDVTLTEYEGMFHVFQMFGCLLPESRAAWSQVGDFVREKFSAS